MSTHPSGLGIPSLPAGVDESLDMDAADNCPEVDVDVTFDEDDYDVASETSSGMFDPEADPEGWERRLDELAGELEMSEVEARALRWGPPMERQKEAPPLPLHHFKELVDHHLATTDWRYNPPAELLPVVPGRQADDTEVHPIRVLGKDHGGVDADTSDEEEA